MPILNILKTKDVDEFDKPPQLTGETRKRFFYLSKDSLKILETLRSPTNQLGYILQRGYFRATNKFFNPAFYNSKDVEYVLRQINATVNQISLTEYTSSSFKRHQKLILDEYAYGEFSSKVREQLDKEALALCTKNTKPKVIFVSLLQYLKHKKIEFPTYYVLAEIITLALRNFEKNIADKINNTLSEEDKLSLDKLFEYSDEYISGPKSDREIKTYKLTLLKKFTHSIRPSRIKENIKDFKELENLFKKIELVIKKANLSNQLIQYYAQFVIKSQIFQVERSTPGRKYLLLISFIAYQYYKLNDMLVDKFIQSSQTILNSSEREHRENFFKSRKTRSKKMLNVAENVSIYIADMNKARAVIFSNNMSPRKKVNQLKEMFSENFAEKSIKIQKELKRVSDESSGIIKNTDYYKMLEGKSIKLQNRASDIIKSIQFDKNSSNPELIEAIEYFKAEKNITREKAPVGFLKSEDGENLFTSDDKIKVSLYKSFLFAYAAKGIKSGSLSIIYSYKYRSFDDYLIPLEYWNNNKKELLSRAGLGEFSDFKRVERKLKHRMSRQIHKTNKSIESGKNEYVSFNAKGSIIVNTPAKTDLREGMKELLPKNRFISIYEILSTVNSLTKFTDNLEHFQHKSIKKRPEDHTLFAGIMGYGCNIGHRKLGRISHNINTDELVNTVNWHFSLDNVMRANDKILSLMENLHLPKVYAHRQKKMHTSSDGQKYNTAVDSLNANYSFKYFGKDQGVSVYTFLDHSHRLFYSTVINPTEREAAYVIDGLMHNDVVKSDIHSTDTHGYSEVIFGTSHLLGISFAPRIKNFKEQQMYGFENPLFYKSKGYKVYPKKKINLQIIEKHWDTILRLAATIKLKESTASQLFKRLSSYSRNHPLYRALKQFGRITKTIFLLKYIDSLELRQMIEKQLNKVESSNKFGKAVFFGDNQEFKYSDPLDQILAVNCRVLIENAVICWNYLYLTKLLSEIKDITKKKQFIQTVKNSSVVTWQHINFQGEYDFSEEMLKNSINFSLPELLEVSAA